MVSEATTSHRSERRLLLVILGIGAPLALMHAFVPIQEFIHRSDDAFYYFGVAANYPRTGFWTFDGIHATNGVQPLWAMILSALAQGLAWFGVEDRAVLARVFVGLTASLHVASAALLFRLLARTVGRDVAAAAAGAMLFSMGLVWGRVWGMENSLYATLLFGTALYIHARWPGGPLTTTALVTGLLLGLTTLTRLNAGFLIPCVLLYGLVAQPERAFRERLRFVTLVGAAATALVGPYLLWNLATTDHLLPVSGAAKAIGTAHALSERGIDSRLSREFLSMLFWQWRMSIQWLLTSRTLDGLWIVGGRLFHDGGTMYLPSVAALGACLLAPAALGRPREWMQFLVERGRRLAPLWYLALFGVVNSAVSVFTYPFQSRAMMRWWFVDSETLPIVLAATLAASVVVYVGRRLVPPAHAPRVAVVALAALALWHAQESIRFYWDGTKPERDWNRSWNEESYAAAQWIQTNLPADALVGSWNAGVVGYYAGRPVVNLDGLINGFDFLPYSAEGRVADYIREQGIRYLSDMNSIFEATGVRRSLPLTELYRHHSTKMNEAYLVYRVDP